MKLPLFEYLSYLYQVDDWDDKKKELINLLYKQDLIRKELHNFETDRRTNDKSYVPYLAELLKPELSKFCTEAEITCSMSDAWCVKYQKGDHQTVHNHKGWGFSGILYVEYDPKVHTPTCFVAPWQEPRSDTTSLAYPRNVKEGTVFIAPSWALHFVNPTQTRKQRTVVVFDLLPELPKHQSINRY